MRRVVKIKIDFFIFVQLHQNIRSIFSNRFFLYHVILTLLSPPKLATGRGERVSILISLIVSVVAGVISYYICKWLDGKHGDN